MNPLVLLFGRSASVAHESQSGVFRARSVTNAGGSSVSRSGWRALGALLLASALQATAGEVSLAWNDNSNDETMFKIERSTASSAYSQIATVGANVTSYTDATVSPATSYSYRVRASNATANSAYTNVLTVTTPSSANVAPLISDIPSTTIAAGTSTGARGFTVSDAETAAGSLVVTGASSNTTLVPNSAIVFGGSGTSRTVNVTPAANQSGSATITVTVSDGTLTASDTFTLTVSATPTNTAPTISTIASQTIASGVSTGALAFTVGDAQTSATSLTLARSSSNTALIPNANIVFGGSGANRTVTVTPASGQTGSATITVTVSDGTATANTTFTVTVSATAPTNTPPTISSISDQTVSAGAATGAIAFTIGDAETSASSLTLSGTSSNTTLVSNASIAFGGSGANRTVTVTPAANQTGSATITVTVRDGAAASTNRSFLLTVNAAQSGNGPVAAFGFDETTGTTVTDASGRGNNGVIQGATRTTSGKFGGALSFNGAGNLVSVKTATSLSMSQAMTIEAWVRPTSSQSGWRTIVQKLDAYYLHASSNTALSPAGGVVFNGDGADAISPSAIASNAWTHVAMTYDSATVRLYVNGVVVSTKATSGAVKANGNDLYIGGNNPYGEFFQGTIDEVRIYDRALSAAEVQGDMQTPVASSSNPPGPSPTWGHGDIGKVGIAGSDDADANNATITVKGSGTDIWDSQDSFRFVYRALKGDGVIEARVDSITNTNEWSKAGVMIRSSLAPNASNAMVLVRPSNEVCAQARITTGGGSQTVFGPGGSPSRYWVRLERKGNSFIASSSTDGITWNKVTTFTIAMGADVYAGFAVTSHNNSAIATGVFSEPFIQ